MLSGCATLQLVSLGLSGVSYIVSGKSLSDHALSKVMDQDCALHRIVLGEVACAEYDSQQSDTLIAATSTSNNSEDNPQRPWQRQSKSYDRSLPPVNKPYALAKADSRSIDSRSIDSRSTTNKAATQGSLTHSTLTQKEDPARQLKFAQTVSPDVLVANMPAVMHIRGAKGSSHSAVDISQVQPMTHFNENFNPQTNILTTDKPQLFAVVGSYNEINYAQQRQKELVSMTYPAKIITNQKGGTKYRVVVGPMTEQQFNHHIGSSAQDDIRHAWRLRLCGDSLSPPPCENAILAKR